MPYDMYEMFETEDAVQIKDTATDEIMYEIPKEAFSVHHTTFLVSIMGLAEFEWCSNDLLGQFVRKANSLRIDNA
jgi:hypothetical protein